MTADANHQDQFLPAHRAARLQGWGMPPAEASALGEKIRRELERRTDERFSYARPPSTPPALPDTRLDGSTAARLAEFTSLHSDDDSRRAYSLGKSYPDLLAARSGQLEAACDAVLRPSDSAQLERILELCAELDIAVVPVGGGTTVVGGIEPVRTNEDQPLVALDTTALSRCHELDHHSRLATFDAGISGPQIEQLLARESLTLGHTPQSFQRSTLGGWIAARSAGQQSLAYGRIEQMVAGVEVVTPEGTFGAGPLPAHAAGPDLVQMVAGSEGTLGVIARATVRLNARPTHMRFASFVFADFESASEAARDLVQSGLRPATVRVSDPHETAFSIASSLPSTFPRSLGRRAVSAAGYPQASLVLVIMPGTARSVGPMADAVKRLLKGHGGRSVGAHPARHWYHARFLQPYVRDRLMDYGLMVDTLETAVRWSRVESVRRDVRHALQGVLGEQSLVACHLSHLYRDGASLYFTFIAPVPAGDHHERWTRAKRAVADVLADSHAAVSHQHGVGTMHADLYAETTAPLQLGMLAAAQRSLDPTGILNPGKLTPRWSRSQTTTR